MRERVRSWMVRSASSAQCSPALIAVAIIVAVAAVCYIYRQIIIDTLEIMGLVLVSGGILLFLGLLARTAYGWHQSRLELAIAQHEAAPVPGHAETIEVLDSADAWPLLEEKLSEADLPGSDTAWDREIDGLLKK